MRESLSRCRSDALSSAGALRDRPNLGYSPAHHPENGGPCHGIGPASLTLLLAFPLAPAPAREQVMVHGGSAAANAKKPHGTVLRASVAGPRRRGLVAEVAAVAVGRPPPRQRVPAE